MVIEGRRTGDAPVDDDTIRAALRTVLATGATKKDAVTDVATSLDKGERVGTKVLEDGRRLRVFRSSGEAV